MKNSAVEKLIEEIENEHDIDLSDITDEIEDLEGDIDDLERDIDDLERDIEKQKEEIQDLEEEIDELETANLELQDDPRFVLPHTMHDNIITVGVLKDLFDNLDCIPIDRLGKFVEQFKKV